MITSYYHTYNPFSLSRTEKWPKACITCDSSTTPGESRAQQTAAWQPQRAERLECQERNSRLWAGGGMTPHNSRGHRTESCEWTLSRTSQQHCQGTERQAARRGRSPSSLVNDTQQYLNKSVFKSSCNDWGRWSSAEQELHVEEHGEMDICLA